MSDPRRLIRCAPAAWRMWRQIRRRARSVRELGLPVPYVLAVSPTMRCNYDCAGCYSGGRDQDDELSGTEIDELIAEAERLGVPVILVTGGEPLLRSELIDLIERHRRLFFVLITNGSLLDERTARRLARSNNTLTLVSVEGDTVHTDSRRGAGAHAAAIAALERLRSAGAFHGFAATASADNVARLASDEFIDGMIRLGCATGYFSEYVPCGERPHAEWLLDAATRRAFRERVLEFRRHKSIVLVQFPHDEYGTANRCSAAGRHSIHIGSRGEVEPCPFVSVSCENVRSGGLEAAIRSPFLRAIRERPELLARHALACALFEHLPEIEALAESIRRSAAGAKA
jgi:MoaA/NifB/PqqE/SkfB family radical SAM enzyme